MPGSFETFSALFAQAPAAKGGSPYLVYLPYAAVIGIWLYLLLIRPLQQQSQQERERKTMLGALKRNDKVVTTAGIFGTVMSVDESEDRVVVRIDDDKGVKVAFTRASIARVLEAEGKAGKAKVEAGGAV